MTDDIRVGALVYHTGDNPCRVIAVLRHRDGQILGYHLQQTTPVPPTTPDAGPSYPVFDCVDRTSFWLTPRSTP